MENSDKPAFIEVYDKNNNPSFGLTKREYFAGLAMQGILASSWGKKENKETGLIELKVSDQIIKASIICADELLEQLKEKSTEG